MTTKNRTKINQLIRDWPKGTVYTALYLKKLGINYDLLRFYKNSQWLESVGNGAYKLAGDKIEWFGGIYALQTQLDLKLHAGGKTALQLKGYSHYVAYKIPKIFIYGFVGVKLPQWFKGNNWETEINFKTTNLFPNSMLETLTIFPFRDFEIVISAPERAAMEMLYHVPNEQGFDEAQKIVEGLFTLRPAIVQKLLENCNSIKVKRLFMYMAEKNSLPWIQELNLSKINFGNGERSIIKNGYLDKKYKITVPRESDI
jgi:hypothetical protein